MYFENEIEHKILVTYVIAKVSTNQTSVWMPRFLKDAFTRSCQSLINSGTVLLNSRHKIRTGIKPIFYKMPSEISDGIWSIRI